MICSSATSSVFSFLDPGDMKSGMLDVSLQVIPIYTDIITEICQNPAGCEILHSILSHHQGGVSQRILDRSPPSPATLQSNCGDGT